MIAIQSQGCVTTNSSMRSNMGYPFSLSLLSDYPPDYQVLRLARSLRPADRGENIVGFVRVEQAALLEVGEDETPRVLEDDHVLHVDVHAARVFQGDHELPGVDAVDLCRLDARPPAVRGLFRDLLDQLARELVEAA